MILPAAAARFWTDRLSKMMVISCVFGAISGVAGTLISDQFEGQSQGQGLATGPMIVLSATVLFLLSWVFAPHRGIFRKATDEVKLEDHLPWAQASEQAGKSS